MAKVKTSKLLSVSDVAELLSVTESAVYRWVDQGRLPYVDLGSDGGRRCIRFLTSDMETFLESRRSSKEPVDLSVVSSQVA
jgi:excisionase family DNA binding protein